MEVVAEFMVCGNDNAALTGAAFVVRVGAL
jgi:hypothetical protein